MDVKWEATHLLPEQLPVEKRSTRRTRTSIAIVSILACLLVIFDLTARWFGILVRTPRHWSNWDTTISTPSIKTSSAREPATIRYNLSLAQAWRNPDGGHWRPMFVGNDKTPFDTINAVEGDHLEIYIENGLNFPTNLHWVSIAHGSAAWNDGGSGITTYPILPRGNFTAHINTTDSWGLKWYLDHVSTPTVDGNIGTIWIAPHPDRKRPYHLIDNDKHEIQAMLDAEQNPKHMVIYNYQHREMPSLLAQLQAEGYDPYCFNSCLINGKGRIHCRPQEVTHLGDKQLDSFGCVPQESGAVAYKDCKPTLHDYEVIETNNQRWTLMNFVNPGLEHPWRISIDDHEFWLIANDQGFVEPQKVDILTVFNAERITVLVKTDKPAGDYAIRFHALSQLQTLQTYAILRYPHRSFGSRLGEPMPQPCPMKAIMNYDGSPKNGQSIEDKTKLHPYPPIAPPGNEKADITLRFTATGAPDEKNPFVTMCSLNNTSWQLFREFMHPEGLLEERDELDPTVRNLPLGSVVDIIVENDLPVTLPMYKHNKATFNLGSGDTKFGYKDVAERIEHEPDTINLKNPPLGWVQELPANGWLALRWKIEVPAPTIFHVFRVRYYVLGMIVPLMEGDDQFVELPDRIKSLPHVDFDLPEHKGIFD